MGTAGLISKALWGLLAFLCHQCSTLLPSAFSGQSVCSPVQASLPRDQLHLSPHHLFPMAERPREDASHCLSTQGQRPGLHNPAWMLSGPPGRTAGARQGGPSAQHPHPAPQGGRLTTLRVRGIRALRWRGAGCQGPTLPQSSFEKDLSGNMPSP